MGVFPLFYQWRQTGMNDADDYSLLVSNTFGTAMSRFIGHSEVSDFRLRLSGPAMGGK